MSVWQRLNVAFLAIAALVALHHVASTMSAILVPFFASAFVVFAMQPSVEVMYEALAGISYPYRWLICCCPRRRKRSSEHEDVMYGAAGSASAWTARPTSQLGEAEDEPLLQKLPRYLDWVGQAFMRSVAVGLALLLLFAIAVFFLAFLSQSASHMQANWEAYVIGIRRWQNAVDRTINAAARELHLEAAVDDIMRAATASVLSQAQDILRAIVNEILKDVMEGFSRMLLVLLYILFWLMQPLPLGGQASAVVRSYLWKKTLVSFLYGICVTILLVTLSVDFAAFFGVVSFFLNYIPEVGAFISIVLPVPIILLDSRLANPLGVLVAAIVGQLFFKLVFGNILEVKLIERDKEMSIHPVWIILGLSYFGYIWGPVGALLSVPLVAMVKTFVLHMRGETLESEARTADAEGVVPSIAESFLACVEGRPTLWGKDAAAESPAPCPSPPGGADV